MITNASTAKVVKEKKGYRVVMGGEVGRKHCLTQAAAVRYIHRVKTGLAQFEPTGKEI